MAVERPVRPLSGATDRRSGGSAAAPRRRGPRREPQTEGRQGTEAASGSAATGDDEGIVLPLSAWRPGQAVEAALRHEVVTLNVPLVGHVTLPGRAHLIWYAGLAGLAALEIVDWPVALLMATAKALSDSHHHELLREFGAALEAGA